MLNNQCLRRASPTAFAELGWNTMVMKLNRTQVLSLAVVTGSLSLAMQLFVPGIPLGGGKLDLAIVPAIVGSAFAGPMAGAIIGFLYGIGSPAYLGLIPSSIVEFIVLGYLAQKLRIRGGKTLAIVISDVLMAPVIAMLIFKLLVFQSVPLLTLYLIGLAYGIPGPIIALFVCGLIETRLFGTLNSSNQTLKMSPKPTSNT